MTATASTIRRSHHLPPPRTAMIASVRRHGVKAIYGEACMGSKSEIFAELAEDDTRRIVRRVALT